MTQPEKIVFRPLHDDLGDKNDMEYAQHMFHILSYGIPREDGTTYFPKVIAELYFMHFIYEN